MKKLLLGLSFSLLASTAFAADAIVEEVVDVAPILAGQADISAFRQVMLGVRAT